jgi:hypothetical protein
MPFEVLREARPLLRQGAAVLPAEISLVAALADFGRWPRLVPGMVEGFDLSALNSVAPKSVVVDDEPDLLLRSAPEPLLRIDLAGELPGRDGSLVRSLFSAGGPVNGVAYWIQLVLAPGRVLEPRPGAVRRGFYARANFAPFAAETATVEGDEVPVAVTWQDRTLAVGEATG